MGKLYKVGCEPFSVQKCQVASHHAASVCWVPVDTVRPVESLGAQLPGPTEWPVDCSNDATSRAPGKVLLRRRPRGCRPFVDTAHRTGLITAAKLAGSVLVVIPSSPESPLAIVAIPFATCMDALALGTGNRCMVSSCARSPPASLGGLRELLLHGEPPRWRHPS